MPASGRSAVRRVTLAGGGLNVDELEQRLSVEFGHPLTAVGTRLGFLSTVVVVEDSTGTRYEVGDDDELTALPSRLRERIRRIVR